MHDVNQDSSGLMWFATYSGVSSFDGFSFKNYDSTSGLPEQNYRKLKCDEKGVFWVIPFYAYGTIVYYENNVWNKLKSLRREEADCDISSFGVTYKDGKPVICIGSSRGLYIYQNDKWKHYNVSDDIALNRVSCVTEKNGKFYISTGVGICIFDNGKLDWSLNEKLKLYGKNILAIQFEQTGTPEEKLWLLSSKWLGYFRDNRFEIFTDKFRLPNIPEYNYTYNFTSLCLDKKGNIFFGNGWAKYLVKKSTREVMPLFVNNGFSSDGATAIFIDRESNVWFSDTRGVDKISNLSFVNYFEISGLLENEVTAICELKDGGYAFGHNNGLSILENNKFRRINFSGMKYNSARVLDLMKDDKGNIWIAANELGLGRLQADDKIKWYAGGKDFNVSAIHQDRSGKIWIGTNKKLYYLKNDKIIEYENTAGISISHRKIYSSDKGGIYIAGRSGLWYLTEKEFIKLPSADGTKSDNVFAYYKSKDGTEFAGTGNGLYVIENGQLVKYNKNGICINNPVYFILQDKENNFWLGSNEGVFIWDGKNKIENYNINNGLAGRETNRSAGILDSKGMVWIGTDLGLSCYKPEFNNKEIPKPEVKLLYIEDGKGVRYSLNENSSVNYDANSMSFHFRGISFVNENLITYKYKLEGYDDSWQEINQSMLDKVRYVSVNPGSYQLLVMAKNFSGEWSEVVKSGTISVKSPVYKTWWFYVILIAVSGSLVFAFFKIRIQRAQNIKLENEISERKQIEQERKKAEEVLKKYAEDLKLLNASKDKFFSIVAHDLKNPFQGLLGFSEILQNDYDISTDKEKKEYIGQIRTASKNAYTLLENLLQWSRLQTGRLKIHSRELYLNSEINAAMHLLTANSMRKKISIQNETDKNVIVVSDKNMLHSILQNLISNAVKFTHENGEISISSTSENGFAIVRVTDNGIGINKDDLEKLFQIDNHYSRPGTMNEKGTGLGLPLCREMTELNGGKIWAESEEDKGSSFCFSIPLKQ